MYVVIENMFDWLSVFLALGIGLSYYKDLHQFIINYFSSEFDDRNVETLTDLDPQTIKELENVQSDSQMIVTIN